MSAVIIKERAEKLNTFKFDKGSHKSIEAGMCATEMASWIAGEPWSDYPKCVSPVIASFMQSWNDDIIDDDERTALLADLVPLTVGTANGKEVEERRAFMCMDWIVREFIPTWLESCDGKRYKKHATALRLVPEITSWQGLIDATPMLADATKEATAVRAAVRAATRAAANAATMNAAVDTAIDVAIAAANAALKPTKEKLQQSARQLVRRMCELHREVEIV